MSVYEIHLKGYLDQYWAACFEGLTLTHEGNSTILCGPLADQAALQCVLTNFGDLNLHLLLVQIIALPGATGTAAGAFATNTRKLTPRETPQSEGTVSDLTQQVPKSSARKTRKRRWRSVPYVRSVVSACQL